MYSVPVIFLENKKPSWTLLHPNHLGSMQWCASDPKIISCSILLPTSNQIAHHSGLIVYNKPKQISLISSLESLNIVITLSLKFKTWRALPKWRGLLTRGERYRGGELRVDGAVHCCRSSRRRERWRSSRRPDCDPEDTSWAKAGPWSIFRSCPCPVAVLQLAAGHPPCSGAAWPFYALSLTHSQCSWSKITKLGSFPKRILERTWQNCPVFLFRPLTPQD